MENSVLERIKKTSIRGRMALGLTCLQGIFNKFQIGEPRMNDLIGKLWEFTSSNHLDAWEGEVRKWEPEQLVLNLTQPSLDNETRELIEVYFRFPAAVMVAIQAVIDIGTSNIYGGTGEFSIESFTPTIKILNITQVCGLALPNLEKFEKSKFTEFHGWGDMQSKSFFGE